MGTYRIVVRHVSYWRGAIHRWSTSYTYVGTLNHPLGGGDLSAVDGLDSAMCYRGPETDGGVYETQAYDVEAGGTAVATQTYFDWENPATWVPFDGSGWSTTGLETDKTRENALLVTWAGGVSVTGKRVEFRHWYHSVPAVAPVAGAPQVSAGDAASLRIVANRFAGALGANGLILGASSGRLASNPQVQTYYGNHQMPKGRRKTTRAQVKRNDSLLGILIQEQRKAAEGA